MALGIYAGATANTVALLPSPVEVTPTHEIIWSEDTGRAQSGTNKAKMIGTVVDTKMTYAIKWGVITATELSTITSKLTAGFFYFAMATTLTSAKSTAISCYRSEIAYNVLPIDDDIYYKDVTVSVIQQ